MSEDEQVYNAESIEISENDDILVNENIIEEEVLELNNSAQNNNHHNNRNRNRNRNQNRQNRYNNNNNRNELTTSFKKFLPQMQSIPKAIFRLAQMWFIFFIVVTLVSCPSREWLRYNYDTYCRGGLYDGTQWTDGFLNFVSNKAWYGDDHSCDQYRRWTKTAERFCPIKDSGLSREIPTMLATATLLPAFAYILKQIFGNLSSGNNNGNNKKNNNRNNNRRN
jgi:hypothetical protein